MNGWAPTTVIRELIVELVAPGEGMSLPVTLYYHVDDPYAVHATFQTGNGDGVRWVFARDLLAKGTDQPTGTGDVRVWPQRAATDVVCISLSSPDGQALVQAPMDEVGEFLARTYALCPLGREGEHLDFDRTIAALLAS